MFNRLVFYFSLSALVFGAVLSPVKSLAHNSGASLERVVEQFKFDIGYDPVVLTVTEPARFDFNILDVTTGDRVEFDKVWVKLNQGNKVSLAGGIARANFGPTTLVYGFKESGVYQLYVRFEKAGQSLVETTFDLTVAEGAEKLEKAERTHGIFFVGAALSGGLLIGGFLGLLLGKRMV